ncbi:heme-degrading domain-containing protein [Paenarthrobacter sp. NyZ202]|uniref:heme-degrading domain-containing protein n=1 Tax=Paenarthrobacter sp. NyZ202 TaxID=3402689 RepID=UPI003CEE5D7E
MNDVQSAPGLIRFSFDEAWRAGSKLVSRCREEGAPVTIGIWLGSQRVFHCALNGTSADNDAWLERKANTVRHFGCSSLEAQERFGHLGNDFFSIFALSRTNYAIAGGAVPIMVQGSMVGVIGVSGLESSEDHALAVWALTEELLEALS